MQRWAVIADCHGNADALAAVLAEVDRLGVSRILNLGDHVSGPLAAGETLDLAMARGDMLSIRGNHDRYVLGDPTTMGASDAAAAAQLTLAHRDWLAALPATRVVEDLFLCHGTPASDETYWLQEVTAGGDVIARNGAEVAGFAAAAQTDASIFLCGHTHLPGIVQLASGALIVNPGSVGLAGYDDVQPVPHVVQSGDPGARFALLEGGPGDWDVSLHRVAYDTTRMVNLALDQGREDWARPLQSGWFTP